MYIFVFVVVRYILFKVFHDKNKNKTKGDRRDKVYLAIKCLLISFFKHLKEKKRKSNKIKLRHANFFVFFFYLLSRVILVCLLSTNNKNKQTKKVVKYIYRRGVKNK